MEKTVIIYMSWEPQIISAIIGAVVSVGLALLTYWKTRNKEIKANIDLKRLDKYDDLLTALTNFVDDTVDIDTRRKLLLAYYSAGAYASRSVLEACYDLLKSIELVKPPQTWDIGKNEKTINSIYNSIRQDVLPKEDSFNFAAYHVKFSGVVAS